MKPLDDFGYKHICVECRKELKTNDDVGAIVLGFGLKCLSCEEMYWGDDNG